MAPVHLILVIVALGCFLFATVGVTRSAAPGAPPRSVNLTALGLFFFVLSTVVAR